MGDFSKSINTFIACMDEGFTYLPDDVKNQYSSLIAKIKRGAKLTVTGFELLSIVSGYLFDPEEGYVALAYQIAALQTSLRETLGFKAEMSKQMRPKADEMEEYMAEIQQLIDKMRDEIVKLMEVGRNKV